MQRRLVHHRATQYGGAVALMRQGQPIEPVGPTGFEMPFEADFVVLSTSSVGLHASKVRSDVVIPPHHMWRLMWLFSASLCGTAARAPRRGARPRGGCSHRVWSRCSWCESASCSATP